MSRTKFLTNIQDIKNRDLSIIIISYNVKDKINKCLNKLQPHFEKWEIIVIDNDSKDGTFKALNKKFSERIILKKNFKNIGFSKAVNQGINLCNGKYILLLNPDTIPSIKEIQKLLDFCRRYKKADIVGGEMIKPKTRIRHGTYVSKPNFFIGLFDFTNLKKIFPNNIFHRSFYYKNEKIKRTKDVWGLSGGFMLIRKEVVKKIGGMDEKFFMYLEDVDFCLRAKKSGLKVIYYPEASIIHDSGSSSSNKYRINIKAWRESRRYFFKKHLNFISGNILSLFFLLDETLIDIKHKFYAKSKNSHHTR